VKTAHVWWNESLPREATDRSTLSPLQIWGCRESDSRGRGEDVGSERRATAVEEPVVTREAQCRVRVPGFGGSEDGELH
jgi:hypothetical protein